MGAMEEISSHRAEGHPIALSELRHGRHGVSGRQVGASTPLNRLRESLELALARIRAIFDRFDKAGWPQVSHIDQCQETQKAFGKDKGTLVVQDGTGTLDRPGTGHRSMLNPGAAGSFVYHEASKNSRCNRKRLLKRA